MIRNESKVQIEQLVRYLIEEEASPAISLAVVSRFESFRVFAGNRQLFPEAVKNDPETIYDLASISKVLVTVPLILKLMEEGLLSLKTRVQEILPEFVHAELTIRHLITHTSGLPSDLKDYKKLSKEEMIAKIYKLKLEYEPGTKVLYSDIGFILLGFVIEKLKGNLADYAKTVIFEPLKMKDSCYNPGPELKKRIAATEDSRERGLIHGEVHDGKAYKLGGISGNAGCFSSIQDISNFVKMLLNRGTFDGRQILNPYSLQLMMTLQTAGLNEKRGLGWILNDINYPLGDYASDSVIFHTGFTGPSILVDFAKGIGVITLANRVHPSRENKKLLELRNNIHNVTLLADTDN